MSARLAAAAPVLLVVSIVARLAWTYLVPNGANFVDLHVYVGGAGMLEHPGTLYDYVYADQTPDFPLPFTYPPFAALVFYPLHLLPFGVVAFFWQLGIFAALYGVVRISQRLLGSGDRRTAMLWTAVGIWIEPLRSTFDYGQINVLLVFAVLYAVYSTRWWVSGLLVGLATGVKLTPAASGLYFVGARRWGAVVFSAVVFFGTVGISWLIIGDETRYYFTELLGDASRIGPIGTSFNQSWRGRHFADPRARRGLWAAGVGRDLCDGGVGGVGMACDRGSVGSARGDRRRAVVRPAAVADLVDAPLGVADPVDDLAAAWATARATGRAGVGLGLAGVDLDRRAVAVELRAADDLGHSPAVVPGLGRPDLHRRDAGDVGVDRLYWPTIALISFAISTSLSVMPPSEWVTNAKVTVRHRMSMSGW